MPRQFVYNCTRCGAQPSENKDEARKMLTAKLAVFKAVGLGGQTKRSRTIAWLCRTCLNADPDYDTPERGFLKQVAEDVVNG